MDTDTGMGRPFWLALAMAMALVAVGVLQSWNVAMAILNLQLISALMALGVNIQWGYGGLFNFGIMGFTALGGLAAVLVAMPPVAEAWAVGGRGMATAAVTMAGTAAAIWALHRLIKVKALRGPAMALVFVVGLALTRSFYSPSVAAIEAVDPSVTGFLGGLGLPIMVSWLAGGALAAAVAWVIGRITLGLQSDYLAIATLGISAALVAVLRNEDWLARGVKNVTTLPRPVPYEQDLQGQDWFVDLSVRVGMDPSLLSGIAVKALYALLFGSVLLVLFWLSHRALHSPWGRMMRAIRDNRDAAEAMGKDVTRRHLQVFVLGSAVVGIAGAMLVTLNGQFTPASYAPFRYTFLIWVMVIVGGSGNNGGAILGGFLIWFLWVQAEVGGPWLMTLLTSGLQEDAPLRQHLLNVAPHMRQLVMGCILLVVLRLSPRGLLPEPRGRHGLAQQRNGTEHS
ncbi:branched-chain amino acid ABC transporter permease [Candidatus Synechococcus spongiarum]|nr:branched-chain amino acid ABC transporter permease [Candidatus Synechococcus spongiarum]